MNCSAYSWIGAAAADITRHDVIDVLIGGVRVCTEQGRRRHDLARLAVTALGCLKLDPGFLDLTQDIGEICTFNGSNLAFDYPNRIRARADWLSINKHRAGPTLSNAATKFSSLNLPAFSLTVQLGDQ
ncbi:MAG: hypothetical protein ACI9UN_000275 [Granulosicoccus sp.]|jgi:hypothetical protein